jgi:hypothetical protein
VGYVLVIAAGLGLGAAAWFPWRRRRPLTIVRAAALVVIAGATGFGLWIAYEVRDLSRDSAAWARAFADIGQGWR